MHMGVRCIVTFVIHWLLCSTVRLWINATDLGTQCARCFTGSNRRVGRSQEPQIWHRGIRSNSPLSLADSGPRLGPCEAQQWDKGRRNPLRGLRRRLGWSVRWPGQAWPWQQYFNIASCDCDRVFARCNSYQWREVKKIWRELLSKERRGPQPGSSSICGISTVWIEVRLVFFRWSWHAEATHPKNWDKSRLVFWALLVP